MVVNFSKKSVSLELSLKVSPSLKVSENFQIKVCVAFPLLQNFRSMACNLQLSLGLVKTDSVKGVSQKALYFFMVLKKKMDLILFIANLRNFLEKMQLLYFIVILSTNEQLLNYKNSQERSQVFQKGRNVKERRFRYKYFAKEAQQGQ